ncbi:hypothetical protein GCM10010297_44420 [Streptomyces malachitofuscus]|nr:hypothetical protein GCM10010297_44420 [Streptomyces malachitofuscus]
MYEPIRRAIRWLGLLFGPGTGVHRVGHARPSHITVRPAEPVGLPAYRSPYCSHLPLDGGDSRLVRPCLVPVAGFGIGLNESAVGVTERVAA